MRRALPAKCSAGLEALWDAAGKAVWRPAHALFGGAMREEIKHFGFPQGYSAEEVAEEVGHLARAGCEVIYVKVGRGDQLDLDIVSQIRAEIGPNHRLRIDLNEHWSPVRAARMIEKIKAYDVEFVEQPTRCESHSALAQVRARSSIAIAADLIVIGLHETGGLLRFSKIAHIAEAAGIDVCLHGLYETGITTCAANQIAATIPNLDDGNQYMNHFLAWDIVKSPDLGLKAGSLPVLTGPGLGFELDWEEVEHAARLHAAQEDNA